MARDGSGNFSLAEAAFVNGTTIDADVVNSDLSDVAAGITQSMSKDGQTVPTASQPMGGFKHTDVGLATARTDYARADQVIGSVLDYALTTGNDTILAAPSPGIAAYVIGQTFNLKKNASANTTAVTLNINSLGAGAVTWPDGTALAAGDLPASGMFTVSVQATTPVFHLHTPYGRPATVAAATLKATLTAKGSTYVASAASTPAELAVGANGAVAMARSAATLGVAYVKPFGSIINGLTYQNNVGDATNDLDISTGACMDATGAYWMVLSALTKRLDAAWAVGTNQGGLDTGAIGDSDYYIWAIARSDTGVTDVLFSLSATAPTMPTSYDFKRLIGWFKRSGGAIVAFKTYEGDGGSLWFTWAAPRSDVALANTLTTARRTDALSVPRDFAVEADIMASAYDAGAIGYAIIYCPDQPDITPTDPTVGSGLTNLTWAPAVTVSVGNLRIRTDATGSVAARSTQATTDIYNVVTNGFHWSRR